MDYDKACFMHLSPGVIFYEIPVFHETMESLGYKKIIFKSSPKARTHTPILGRVGIRIAV